MPTTKKNNKEFTIDGYSKYVKSIDDFTALKVASKMIDGLSGNIKMLTECLPNTNNLTTTLHVPSEMEEIVCQIESRKDSIHICIKFFDNIAIFSSDVFADMYTPSEAKDTMLGYCISCHEEHFKQKEVISIGLSKYEKAGLYLWDEKNVS